MGGSKIEGLHAKALELSLPNQGRKSFLSFFELSANTFLSDLIFGSALG
jgi:hypothetical protein